jgi:signal transduction histidine kinase
VLTASAEVWAFGGNWVVPFVAPLAVLVLMVPVMIAIPYLSPRWVAATVLVMLVTAAAASGLAEYRRDVTPVIPLSIRVVCLVVFIPMVVAVIAFEVRQLYLDLSTRAEDLRSSRTQVAAVADAARRSLERDLHDGAQQRLVGLTVQLALVRDQLDGGDVAGARHVLDELNRETHEAIRELRELAQGIYPPLLAERGLVPAVKAAARRSVIPCTVIAEPLPRYPEAVEAAAYFCILEALQNAAKHSGADEVTVQLRADPTLEFAVIDRGRGFDPGAIEHRSGLLGMQARVGAVGGTLRVSSDGDGTVVRGAIPRAQHPDGTTDERADDAVSNR